MIERQPGTLKRNRVIESSARGLSLQKRERIIFHLSFSSAICRIYLALFRVISWIVRWTGERRAIYEITRTGTKHNDQWEMTNGK
jgi:hypothetical protein